MKRMGVHELELRTHSLEIAIHELDRRGSPMTPHDRLRATELKRLRLVAKDQLDVASPALIPFEWSVAFHPRAFPHHTRVTEAARRLPESAA
jgi:hypothetical protein